jgi:hypothetical protein
VFCEYVCVLLHMFCMLIILGSLCARFIIHTSHCISCIHYSHNFFYMKREYKKWSILPL